MRSLQSHPPPDTRCSRRCRTKLPGLPAPLYLCARHKTRRKAACIWRHANLRPINLTLLSLSFSPRDLCIPSVLSKLSSKSMTVTVSSDVNPCKLYSLSSLEISMVSAVSLLLKLPRTLHNHFQLPSCSLTQGHNSDCHPLCSRSLFGTSSACLGTSLHAELHVPGQEGRGASATQGGWGQWCPLRCQDKSSAHKTPENRI